MEKDIGNQLKMWAIHMGYQPPCNASGEVTLDFNRICNARTKDLWREVITRSKPSLELDHIRRNVILNRTRNRKMKSSGWVSGSLGKQLKMQQELKQLKEQKQGLLHDIENQEMSIRDIKRNLQKKYSQTSLLQIQLKDSQRKSAMLQIKKQDCESFVTWLDDLANIAKNIFPPPTEFSELQKKTAVEALERCVKVVDEYQTWHREALKSRNIIDQEEHQLELEERKLLLWKTVSACIGELPPALLWHSLTSQLIERNVLDMASLAESANLKSDVDAFRFETECGGRLNNTLSTMHIKCMTETAGDLVKANILAGKRERLLGEIADEMEELVARSDLNATASAAPREKILEWLRLRCLRIQLETAKQALRDEVSAFKKKSLDLESCAQQLKEEKAAVFLLDDQIAEVQASVEQGLASVNGTVSKLESARQGVIEQLEKFSLNRQPLIPNDITTDVGFNDTVNKNVFASTTVNFMDGSMVCSTPAPIARLQCPSRNPPRFDDTVVTNDSGIESTVSAKNTSLNLPEIVATLRNAVSNESKTFFKLPLCCVPKLKLAGSTGEINGVLVNSPQLIAQLASSGLSSSEAVLQLFQSSAIVHSPQVLMSLLQNMGHLRAAKLRQLVGRVQPPTSFCVDMSLHYFKVTAPKQNAAIRQQLDDTVAFVENAKEENEKCGENYNLWVSRPIQRLVPDTLKVNGMTFKDWMKKYNSLSHNGKVMS